ncbi:hypothetical protein C8R43DRAFT_497621 [Mycena crocata]|nr:hypothetical protein C8R43DRAFT_497621 [Mycena crocata]
MVDLGASLRDPGFCPFYGQSRKCDRAEPFQNELSTASGIRLRLPIVAALLWRSKIMDQDWSSICCLTWVSGASKNWSTIVREVPRPTASCISSGNTAHPELYVLRVGPTAAMTTSLTATAASHSPPRRVGTEAQFKTISTLSEKSNLPDQVLTEPDGHISPGQVAWEVLSGLVRFWSGRVRFPLPSQREKKSKHHSKREQDVFPTL